jgi:hypothetical protein
MRENVPYSSKRGHAGRQQVRGGDGVAVQHLARSHRHTTPAPSQHTHREAPQEHLACTWSAPSCTFPVQDWNVAAPSGLDPHYLAARN